MSTIEGVEGISNTCGSKQSLNIELILHHAMPPKWKRNPPCTAHKILEKMFSEDKISRDAQPSTVYNLHAEFQKFSLPVFRTVFNEIRNSYGLDRKNAKNVDFG